MIKPIPISPEPKNNNHKLLDATSTTVPTPDIIPAMVSLNQIGYYPSSKKIALLAHDSTEPLEGY